MLHPTLAKLLQLFKSEDIKCLKQWLNIQGTYGEVLFPSQLGSIYNELVIVPSRAAAIYLANVRHARCSNEHSVSVLGRHHTMMRHPSQSNL